MRYPLPCGAGRSLFNWRPPPTVTSFTNKEAAIRVEKLLLSAIKNWEAKNEDKRVEDSNLFVKEVSVGGGRQLKRLRPAPQGRGYRIRKRSNHVTLIVDSKNDNN